jgi:cell shape-determining protein MreC
MKISKALVTQYPRYTTLNLSELDKLQEEIESFKQQIKLIERKQKKRRWQKHGKL